MEIDEVMSSPLARWVFRCYAILTSVTGALLFGWGPLVLGSDLPGLPYYRASLIRATGGILLAAACFAFALEGVDEPAANRRALRWFGIGHMALFAVLASQQVAIWNSPLVDGLMFAVMALASAFFFFSSGTSMVTGEGANRTVLSLFGTQAEAGGTLRSRYQRQIRAAASQEERHRLARDLHDSVKQQIFAIQTAAATAQTRFDTDAAGTRAALEQVRASARDAMAEMEAMLDQLRAAPLENAGLVAALRGQCEALGLRTGAQVEFEVGALPDSLALEPGAQEALFRVAQEALANVARHARAGHVRLRLAMSQEGFSLAIDDDGAGFDPDCASGGMGLSNMRARAAEFGGTFELASSPGGGTRVTVAMPVAPALDAALSKRASWGYAAAAVASCAFGIWRHSPTFLFAGIIWGLYCARIAAVRWAARRRREQIR